MTITNTSEPTIDIDPAELIGWYQSQLTARDQAIALRDILLARANAKIAELSQAALSAATSAES